MKEPPVNNRRLCTITGTTEMKAIIPRFVIPRTQFSNNKKRSRHRLGFRKTPTRFKTSDAPREILTGLSPETSWRIANHTHAIITFLHEEERSQLTWNTWFAVDTVKRKDPAAHKANNNGTYLVKRTARTKELDWVPVLTGRKVIEFIIRS